jgi:hypothetical protein
MTKTTTTMTKTSWFNQTQIDFVTALQKFKVAICGRGFGKTTMIALILFLIVKWLPRSKGFLAAKTIEQIEDEILPQIRKKLRRLGFIEGIHFVVGKPPPDWYEKPISPIKNYKGAMIFWNGTICRFLSHARPAGRRGGTYDWGIIDEALEMKEAIFDSVFSQLVRGNLYTFMGKFLKKKTLTDKEKEEMQFVKSLHHSLFILTSRPKKAFAFWIYRFRKLQEQQPDKYLFLEASAKDNKDALGDDWFKEQKERLSPMQYATEIENEEISKLPDGYFYMLQRGKHTYRPQYDQSRRMLDIRKNDLLELSLDFGGKFNCMTIWQEFNGTEYLRRQLYVKNERKTPAMIDDFCQLFADHEYKYVRLWGEPRGNNNDPMDETYYAQVQRRLKKNGWMSDVMTPMGYKTAGHSEIYDFLEIVLGEEDVSMPGIRINEDACVETLIALETADVLFDKGLDKSKEKDENFSQELATHLPDTFRYYLFLKYGLKKNSSKRRAGRAETV